VKSALQAALIAGVFFALLESGITSAVAVGPPSWLRHHAQWFLPLVWIVVPLLVIVWGLAVARKRRGPKIPKG
jgi:hypothetical protein